jgi:hypothetical protein
MINNTEFKNACELLNRNYTIVTHQGKTYNKQQLDNATNFIKNQLCQQFDNQLMGRVVYPYTNELFWIVATLRACWQLGCTVFVADYNPGYSRIPEFKDFHNFIDIVVGHNQEHVNSCDQILIQRPRIIFENCDIEKSYNADFNIVLDLTLPAVTTHTSGTTGYPKLIHFSHCDVINISKSQAKFSHMQKDEVAIHQKTLHHGSLFSNYALPLLSMCDRHYCFHNAKTNSSPLEYVITLLDQVIKHGITRVMVPYDYIRRLTEVDNIDLQNKVIIHTILGPTDQEMKHIVEKIKPRSVINMWGCSEIGSCFHSVTDQTNVEFYNPNRFHLINPDLDYAVEDTCIRLKWKFSDQCHVIGDYFKIQQDVLWWQGRVNFISKNGIKVNVSAIKSFLENAFNTLNFSIVMDYELNQLYLAVFDQLIPPDLTLLNSMLINEFDSVYTFNKIKVLNYNKVLMGVKPSQPILLYMFRNNEQTS